MSTSQQQDDQRPISVGKRPNDKKSGGRGNPHGPGRYSRNAQPSQSVTKLARLDYDPAEYQLISHLPRRCPRGPGDVYITLKTPFRAQMDRCKKLLQAPGCRQIVIHAMGAATNRAVNLALQLQADFQGLLQLSPTTGSLELTDELEPLRDDLDPISQSRFVSAIQIAVFFVKNLEDIKNKEKI
jgi:Alba